MIEMLSTMFSYQFMVRALIVGLLVSLCAALLGVSLVLKRYSMIGDGLSHVGFGALAVATALGMAPMAVTIPVVVAAAFLLLRLSSTGRLKGDAAIAMISTGALAVGVIVLGWGIVQVGLSLQSHDPSQRSNGFLTLAGGVIITFAKEILTLITGT